MRRAILWWLYSKAYPSFDCEDCVGMREYGCYCAAMGSAAPGVGPTGTQRLALWAYRKLQGRWFSKSLAA